VVAIYYAARYCSTYVPFYLLIDWFAGVVSPSSPGSIRNQRRSLLFVSLILHYYFYSTSLH